MPNADGKEDRVDIHRRDFLGKSGSALAAVGVVASVPGAALGQQTAAPQQAAPPQVLRQTSLQDYMLKADSAMARIAKGIHAGLVDEVAAGAEDLEKALRAIEQANTGQPAERQAGWKKRSGEAADNAKKLHAVAAAARQKGDKEIAAEIVDLFSTAMRATATCHATFRQRG
jgi:hypothetical protein